MKTTRRTFIKTSALAGGALTIGLAPARAAEKIASKPLRILILGGTGFTGPFQVKYALERKAKSGTW
ncbi:MAG: twin-arginine translocation signal domain-containing protein [Verrucomicrobiaceae bacterium]|nr:twin-arginine translocation signal domain-containing protein [Verrucomicrobiaceae bacterium]